MAAEVETMYSTREKPWHGLGVVTNRYKVAQNDRDFSFTNELLGHGVRVESAGSLFGGRKPRFLQDFPENTYPRRKNRSLSCVFQYT